jgi:hypothetical protein
MRVCRNRQIAVPTVYAKPPRYQGEPVPMKPTDPEHYKDRRATDKGHNLPEERVNQLPGNVWGNGIKFDQTIG